MHFWGGFWDLTKRVQDHIIRARIYNKLIVNNLELKQNNFLITWIKAKNIDTQADTQEYR